GNTTFSGGCACCARSSQGGLLFSRALQPVASTIGQGTSAHRSDRNVDAEGVSPAPSRAPVSKQSAPRARATRLRSCVGLPPTGSRYGSTPTHPSTPHGLRV